MPNKFKVGSWVRLRLGRSHTPGRRGRARIIRRAGLDVPGGVVLDRPFVQFRLWHVDDLESAPPPKRPNS